MEASQVERQMKTLTRFVGVYCRKKHAAGGSELCSHCEDLLNYARQRLAKCPLDPKPACKNCPVHCYQPQYRARMREVMKFSGIHFVKRGRIDWLLRYFLRK